MSHFQIGRQGKTEDEVKWTCGECNEDWPCESQKKIETGKCANCLEREATINWVGEGGTIAYVHGMYSRWCELCATREQLRYAKEQAAVIPELEIKLAELEKGL